MTGGDDLAQWVSHCIVADRVLARLPWLDRHAFCVGSIAPDCNLPNEDWSSFTPSREITHRMRGSRKSAEDCAAFCRDYILDRIGEIRSRAELSFLFGYYAHLITDAEMQRSTRDESRVAAAWARVRAVPALRERAEGLAETWDDFKKLISAQERLMDVHCMEREYLDSHPDSCYFTELLDLERFPDYIDLLPPGAIPKKVRMMFYLPAREACSFPFIAFSREEYAAFLDRAAALSAKAIEEAESRVEQELRRNI